MTCSFEQLWTMANSAAEMKLTVKKIKAVSAAFAAEYMTDNDSIESIRTNWEQFNFLFWALEGIIEEAVKQAEDAETYSNAILEELRTQKGA